MNYTNEKHIGVIYILTNPSFPDYVKIGYANDVTNQLKQLNKSECTPFSFRVYATYEVDSRLSDMKIHSIIDKLNPDLRSIETVESKKRVREFYAMSPEDAYELFKAIAEIHGFEDRLKLWGVDCKEKNEEQLARTIKNEVNIRGENISFHKCGIPIGSVFTYIRDESITCVTVDDRRVEYNGQVMYLTTLAKMLLGRKSACTGPAYFKYNGRMLQDYYVEFQRNRNFN